MSNTIKYKIKDVAQILEYKYNAKETTIDELYELSDYIDLENEYISKIYKIEDVRMIQSLLSKKEKEEIEITIDYLQEEDEEISVKLKKITTGKLIIIILESEDKVNLSGFVMEGNGEKLYDYLANLLSDKLEKGYNQVDEIIEDLNEFRPYGKYFK